jgi:hypothetical protein
MQIVDVEIQNEVKASQEEKIDKKPCCCMSVQFESDKRSDIF